MKLLTAFLRLIRWPNLLFIVLAQVLFLFIVFPALTTRGAFHTNEDYVQIVMFMLASVFIAAGGYVINDYFDVRIDAVNKPEKLVIGKIIKRRWAIVWHLVLSFLGLLLTAYISFYNESYTILAGNIICVVLLWAYSVHFKKSLLLGNLMIALLTAWVIFSCYEIIMVRYGYYWSVSPPELLKGAIFYAEFAGLLTLIREAVKDAEDVEGDRAYGAHTMPIKWGIPGFKIYTGVLCLMMLLGIGSLAVYAYIAGYIFVTAYAVILIIAPMIVFLKKLYTASTSRHYHILSNLVKLIMLAGILSMILFLFTDIRTK